MSTEIAKANPAEIFSSIATTSIDDFRKEALSIAESGAVNVLTRRSQRDGKTDTVMHVGEQIKTDMIVGHVLTIIRVGHAAVPATDAKGNPLYVTDSNGVVEVDTDGNPVQAISIFPVCHFVEAPGCWYNGGKLLQDNIDSWADEVGDDPTDFYLPKLNAVLSEIGGIRAFFDWKDKKDGSGQRYVNMILA